MKQTIEWQEQGQKFRAPWLSESDQPLATEVLLAADELKAIDYLRLSQRGAVVIWRGDFHNAKQLIGAVQRRIDKKNQSQFEKVTTYPERIHLHRKLQKQRAQLTNRLLCFVDENLKISLPRAPDLRKELLQIHQEGQSFLISFKELQGLVGAYQWSINGIYIEALGQKIYPHFGVYSATRNEYLTLIQDATLPASCEKALDVGTGTGVLAALLAHKGVPQIWATDLDDRALSCARDNFTRLGLQDRIHVEKADLFCPGRFDLILFNPPWLPLKPTSSLEAAVYDENHQTLKRFLSMASKHLSKGGQVWIILSNLAVLLGLRLPDDLKKWVQGSGFKIAEEIRAKPLHKKAANQDDPLYSARSQEVTSLFRLEKERADPE